jgi:FAD/FMN-containing dehydrogenase
MASGALWAGWRNWSGSVECAPAQIAMPTTEAEIAALVATQPQGGVRVAGTGHSFTPLCATDGTLISLDGMQGLIEADAASGTATFRAGTKISQMGAPLLAAGLAMANMGDIDTQALAGAVGTGTHGTGQTLGSISTQVVGMRLVLATGDLLDCSPEHEPAIFNAARVSVGTFGILTRITLRVLPAYRLHERTWPASFEECMAQLPTLIAENRHFEFFWSPGEDMCAMKTLNPTAAEALEEERPVPAAPGRMARYLSPERIDWSYRIFPSVRAIKFVEMEFSVPAAHGPDCFSEIRQMMRTRHPDVLWPIEYRTLHSDDIPLSTASGRETVTISIHQAAELPYRDFFADAEAIFRNHHGRPHWGKMHTHTARELRDLYPRWDAFLALRAQVDPDGRFLNTYLRELFSGQDDRQFR